MEEQNAKKAVLKEQRPTDFSRLHTNIEENHDLVLTLARRLEGVRHITPGNDKATRGDALHVTVMADNVGDTNAVIREILDSLAV